MGCGSMKALAPPCPEQSYHSEHKPRQTGLYGQAWEEEASISIFQLRFEKSFLSAIISCRRGIPYVDQSDRRYNTYQLVVKELWRGKQTSPSGFALGIGSFTAIIP